ncbi:CpaF family protein [Amnibacterium setariae]|uniref:Pilus assembly protein CpaF n=1 Tax=Amnibacterium setariae TaxID=2306585 RepID=A0A3A1TWK1_9MICO|nr:ATPase, T2SS/T4P/T4SS family [Amnibacterium setariae]RIX26518.1 pilus assembly protein CpaF [Amnibacterium setariae]
MVPPFVPLAPPGAVPPGAPSAAASPAPIRLPELGPLAPHAQDPAVTDLLIDGAGALWRDAGHGLEAVPDLPPLDAAEARRLAVALVAAGGRHLDDATPCVDVRLPGARVHAVLPPVSTGGPLVSVRIAPATPWRLVDLERLGMLEAAQGAALREAVRLRRNLLVCGPAGSGKTALLAALMAEVPAHERIVTVEDVAEIVVEHPHVVGLEARQPNSDGVGGVGLAALVRETLRMRPDRIVVGECRGAEIAELLSALNTGHDGGAGTVHCADPDGLGARLEALGALAGLPPAALRAQALAAIDVVVQLGRSGGLRRVERIGALAARADGSLVVVDP